MTEEEVDRLLTGLRKDLLQCKEFERSRLNAGVAVKALPSPPVSIVIEVWPDRTTVTATRDDGRTCTNTMKRDRLGWKGVRKAALDEAEVTAAFDGDSDDITDALDEMMSAAQDIHQALLLDV